MSNRRSQAMSIALGAVAAVVIAGFALGGGCAHSPGAGGGGDGDGGVIDAGVGDDADACAGVTCDGLTYCERGDCVPYLPCSTEPGNECPPGETCRNDVCIPDDVDADGDSYNASSDCDETNPQINPSMPERCNGLDDDCDTMIDEGDPVALCDEDPSGDVCENGSCGCLPGTFDLDPTVPDCECVAAPVLDQGATCDTAIDLGDFPDNGAIATVAGNIVPDGRQVWYRFRGVDNADTACDNLHVRAVLAGNPTDQFTIRVLRGDCSAAPSEPVTDYDWYTDLRSNVAGVLTGQCPCWSGTPVDNVSPCADDSADYRVVVERVGGTSPTCEAFGLELSNGVYDAP